MKLLLNRLYSWIMGDFGDRSLEHHFLISMSLIGVVFFMIASFSNYFFLDLSIYLSLLTFLSSIFYLVIFILGRKRKEIKNVFGTLVIVSVAIFSCLHFLNAGSAGPVGNIYLIAIAFFLFVQKLKYRKRLLAYVILDIIAIAIVEIYYPELVVGYTSRIQMILDVMITLLLSIIVLWFIISYVRKHFDREKTRALAAEKLKSNFLTNMSHEIRTPLNGILGYAQLLNDVDVAEDQRVEFRQQVTDNAYVLMKLMDDVLEITNIESGSIMLNKCDININDLLDDIYNEFKNDTKLNHNSDVNFVLNNLILDKKTVLISDEVRLRQVITNIVNNAIKFTDRGSIVFGYSILEDGFMEFYITDTGIGIPKEEIKDVFNKFNKQSLRLNKHRLGAGLGLSISKNLIHILGGQIIIDSEEGIGTDVRLLIPLHSKIFQ